MLKEKLKALLEFPIVGIKLGTETEDCSFEDISYIYHHFKNELPLTLKIGGPEARNDMRFAIGLGIHKILAPMVETPYALENFVTTILEIEKDFNKVIEKSINIETAIAVSHLDGMIEGGFLESLDSITIGRSDLSASIKSTSITDFRVNNLVSTIIHKLKYLHKPISIGGSLNKDSILFLQSLEHPHLWVNTRHVIMKFDFNAPYNYLESMVNKALEFEISLYENLLKEFPLRAFLYKKRIDTIKKRF